MRKLLITLIMLVGFTGSLLAQKTVNGTVTDEESNPLAGVTVMVQGTSVGTLTDADGKFSLSVPSDAQVLVFTFVGMKSQEVAIGNQTTFNVTMTVDIGMLEEVIVIGYGTVKKKDLTGAVTRLNAEDLQTEANSNMTSMLRGAIPGLSVALTTDPKGLSDPSSMLIRGETSLRSSSGDQADANAPLVVVDGMIYYGDLADINPVDIESFDILKDASSAAIYGSRASNGVILITTKKGVKGKPVISINTSTGFAYSSPVNLPLMNGAEFLQRRFWGFEQNERRQITIGPGYYNKYDDLPSGVDLATWKAYDGSGAAPDLDGIWLNRLGLAPIEIANYEAGKETDFSQYTWQTGLTQDYTASISGSADAVSYYLSVGYTNNEGIAYNDSFTTYRARLNLESTITSWLKVGTNTQMAFRDESPISVGVNFYNTPYSSMYEADGKTLLFAPSGYINAPNFWLEMTYHERFIKYNTFNTKLYGTLTFPLGITFTSEFIPRFNWNRNYQHWSSGHDNWATFGGRASRSNTTIFEWQVNNMLKWNKTYDVHAFDVTLVQNAEKYQSWYDNMDRQNFLPSDVLGYHRMQAGADDNSIESNDQVSTADALLARLNYTLMDKYNLTTSVRRDGYSAFGQANPHATFWSAAAGWTISSENFFNVAFVDLLKLRLSYGTNGNRGVGTYDALSNLNTGKFVLITNGTPGYVSQLYTSRMANQELKWERTTALNVGIDFAVLKGRLRGNIDAYSMQTKDLLIPRQLPNITGYSSVFSNLGQVDNKGFEISLNSLNIGTRDFSWTTDFSLAFNRNKIVHLYGDYAPDPVSGEMVEQDDITNGWFIGHAVDQIWDYKTLGIWRQDEEADANAHGRVPGDYKLWDADGNGIYTDADKQFQGYTRPPFRLTFRNTVTWKDFELSVKMYGNIGQYRADNYLRNNEAFYDRSTYYDVPYWTTENQQDKWARIDSYEDGFTVWENNSFVRIDNVSLSYNVPRSFLERFNIESCRLSVVSDNPYVIAPGWSWMDPENNSYTPSYISFKLNLTL